MQKNDNSINLIIQLNPNIYLDWNLIEKRKTQFQPMHKILLTHKLDRYCNQRFIYLQKRYMSNKLFENSLQPRMILLRKISDEIEYNLDIIKSIYKLNAIHKERMNRKNKSTYDIHEDEIIAV